jgi:hypothetical protein
MPELGEYEIKEPRTGTTTRVQLTDEDAKKFPHAKRVGTVRTPQTADEGTDANAGGAATHQHEPVSNRARQSK